MNCSEVPRTAPHRERERERDGVSATRCLSGRECGGMLSLSLSHTLSHTFSLSHTHTRTHSLCLSHTHSHSSFAGAVMARGAGGKASSLHLALKARFPPSLSSKRGCACVCVREREAEIEGVRGCERQWVRGRERVCVRERERRDRVCVCVCMFVKENGGTRCGWEGLHLALKACVYPEP
jgi:hypothetical protein